MPSVREDKPRTHPLHHRSRAGRGPRCYPVTSSYHGHPFLMPAARHGSKSHTAGPTRLCVRPRGAVAGRVAGWVRLLTSPARQARARRRSAALSCAAQSLPAAAPRTTSGTGRPPSKYQNAAAGFGAEAHLESGSHSVPWIHLFSAAAQRLSTSCEGVPTWSLFAEAGKPAGGTMAATDLATGVLFARELRLSTVDGIKELRASGFSNAFVDMIGYSASWSKARRSPKLHSVESMICDKLSPAGNVSSLKACQPFDASGVRCVGSAYRWRCWAVRPHARCDRGGLRRAGDPRGQGRHTYGPGAGCAVDRLIKLLTAGRPVPKDVEPKKDNCSSNCADLPRAASPVAAWAPRWPAESTTWRSLR